MTIQVVNGYVCLDCADVALAKKDINPAHPPNSPNAQPSDPNGAAQGSSNTQSSPAVTFGGSLSQLPGANAVQPPGGSGQTQLDPSQTNPIQPNLTPSGVDSTKAAHSTPSAYAPAGSAQLLSLYA